MKKLRIILFSILMLIIFLINRSYQNKINNLDNNLLLEAEHISLKLENELNDYFRNINIFTKMIEFEIKDNTLTIDKFNELAKIYLNDNIKYIYYAPEAITQWAYPIDKSSKQFMNVDISKYPPMQDTVHKIKDEPRLMGPYFSDYYDNYIFSLLHNFRINNTTHYIVFVYSNEHLIEFFESPKLEIFSDDKIMSIYSNVNGEDKLLYPINEIEHNTSIEHDFTFNKLKVKMYLDYKDRDIILRNHLLLISTLGLILYGLAYTTLKLIYVKRKEYIHNLYYDNLTHIYNRNILDKLVLDINNSKIKNFVLFYIDLNKFKPVNDTYGHEIGDKLLCLYASRLKSRFSKNDIAIRLGGDEFVLIIKKKLSEDQINQVIDRLINLSNEAFNIGDLVINISASIGYAIYPNDALTIDEILLKADNKMYINKKNNNTER